MSFRRPQTITRYTGAYVYGKWVSNPPTTFTILASVQPVTGEDVQSVAGAQRLSDLVKVYTASDLQVLQEGSNLEPDHLTWRGHDYRCISVDVRQMDILPHFKYIFAKVSQT